MIAEPHVNGFGSNWATKRLKYVAPAANERADASAAESGYVGLENVESWTGRLVVGSSQSNLGDASEPTGTSARFTAGDVLFGKLRPYLAKAVLAEREGVCSTELLVLRPTSEIEGRYLQYFLLCPHVVSLINSSAFGTKMPRASWDFIGTIRVPIPHRSVQERIAAFLDAETAEIDALVSEKERMLSLSDEKRAVAVTRAVTRGLDHDAQLKRIDLVWTREIPEHWEVMQLKRTWASAEYGISESIRDEGDIRVLRMSCITKDGLIDVDNAGQVEDVAEALLVHRGDLLFNRTNSMDQIAKVGWMPDEPEKKTSFASYLVRIRLNERACPAYLVALLNSRDFLTFARTNAIPAIGQANLSPSRYGDIKIALPPAAEQRDIIKHLANEAAESKRIEQALRESVRLLKERRSALITAAVSGQIPIEEMPL